MPVKLLITNDDGIDSVGLHVLARAMQGLGEVVVVAPDGEYSGASAAFGALHLIQPEVHAVTLDGIDEAYSVAGPPALCVLFGRLGVFGSPPDLIVAGINPGANVGRAIYHSGTVGAAITARNGGVSGVAISQDVADFGIEGQGWDDMLASQRWDSAAAVARVVVEGLLADLPSEPVVLNVNVPNLPLEELKGWRHAEVGMVPPRTVTTARLEPRPGHDRSFKVIMEYGEAVTLPIELDGGAVTSGYVALSWLSRMSNQRELAVASVLDHLVQRFGEDAAI